MTQLFNSVTPDVYRLEDIYDPDVHGTYPTADGKIVPGIGSILVDGTTLFTVTEVDGITFKTTYVPATIVTTVGDGNNGLLSHGNDRYMLYYDDRVTPSKLIIDSKYMDTTGAGIEYMLIKVAEDGTRVPMSLFVNTQGVIAGERVPMVATAIPGIVKCANCYTLEPIATGELVELEVYDGSGVLTTIVKLTGKKANILNDFGSEINPVVDFIAGASQESGDEWLLYMGQDPDDLAIWVKLVFADGTLQNIAIDNMSCFMYGFEDLSSNFPRKKFEVMLKYFLPERVPTALPVDPSSKSITLTKTVLVDVKLKTNFSKISVMLLWNTGTLRWEIRYFAYYQTRDTFEDVTSSVTYTGDAFDATIVGLTQNIVINVPNETGDPINPIENYTQDITIVLNNPIDLEPYLISTTGDAINVYGVHGGPNVRPAIRYDAVLEQYFIPTSLFTDTAAFLTFFYDKAAAPWLVETETEAPTPTYFTLREVTSGRLLLAEPITLANYDALMTLLTTGGPEQFVDSTIVVEFLTENAGTYSILYGVPVDIKAGTYNV